MKEKRGRKGRGGREERRKVEGKNKKSLQSHQHWREVIKACVYYITVFWK